MVLVQRKINFQVEVLWMSLLQANLSIVIKDDKGLIIGACLNFDARADEAAPLCAASAFSSSTADLLRDTYVTFEL